MPSVFICYRREDTAPYAGWLRQALVAAFGKDRVFMDIDAIAPGLDFEEVIQGTLDKVDAVLVVIGPKWATVQDAANSRRLDNPDDYIRLEVGIGLRRRIRVVPVLVGGATVPRREQLPADLQQLARRQAVELSETRWEYDTSRLIESLKVLDRETGSKGTETPDLSAQQPLPRSTTESGSPEVAPIAALPSPTTMARPEESASVVMAGVAGPVDANRNPWRVVWGTTLAMVALAFAEQGSILPSRAIAAASGPSQWAAIISSIGPYVGWILGSAAGGYLGDRAGRRRVLLGGVAFGGLLTAFVAVTADLTVFGLVRSMMGLAIGAAIPNAMALSSEHAPKHRKSVAVTLTASGYVFGGLLISGLSAHFGLSFSAALSGTAAAAVAALSLRMIPRSPHRHPPESLLQPGIRRHTVLSSVFFFLSVFAGAVSARAVLALQSIGMSASTVAWITTLASMMAVAFGISAGFRMDRYGARPISATLIALSAAAAALIGFGVFLDPLSWGLGSALASAVQLTAYAAVLKCCIAGLEARSVGVAVACGRVGLLLSPVAGAAVQAAGIQAPFVITAFTLLVLIMVARMLTRERAGISTTTAPAFSP